MGSTLLRKSWRDLRQRKLRSIFTILTIMLGVAALGMFAVMPIVDGTMQKEIRTSNMHDVLLQFNDTVLDATVLCEIEGLDNVDGAEAMSILYTKVYIGERRNIAWIIGVQDLDHMTVDRISVEEGRVPIAGSGELLTERGNIDVGLLEEGVGGQVSVYDSSGTVRSMEITGIAHNPHMSGYPFAGSAVFYADLGTVRSMANTSGYNMLALDLSSSEETVAMETIDEVSALLSERISFNGYSQVPIVRKEGDWPLKMLFDSVGKLFNVIAYIVLFCGLFLISNTMHTIITEQRREIAQMKAIGATSSQVVRSYLTTSLIMGMTGSLLGTLLGILIAIGMANMFGMMVGIKVGFGIHVPTVVISFLVGCLVTVLASAPALLMALWMKVRDGMEGCGISSSFGSGPLDRMMMWTMSASIPMVAHMGLRNASRRKGRSLSTMLQVALAVGMLLGVVTSCIAMSDEIDRELSCATYDIQTSCQDDGSNPLTVDVGTIIGGIQGVRSVEPFISTMVGFDGYNTIAQAYSHDTGSLDIENAIGSGRWFSAEEEEGKEHVMVMNKRLSSSLGVEVGDSVQVMTRAGPMSFEVVGIGIQVNVEVYMPFSTVRDTMGYGQLVSGFNVFTESAEHAGIDRVATEIEDTLAGRGYLVNTQVYYVTSEQTKRGAESTVAMMIASGALIVFVTLIGLMSMLTMNVIERTREIGILRCLGSSTVGVASVFGTEGLLVTLGGWAMGLPVGYLVQMLLTWTVSSSSGMDIALIYPLPIVMASLLATLAITVLIIQPPLWRAGHFRPGEALRYQ